MPSNNSSGSGPFEMTELAEAAVSMHEMYIELKKAGFTRGESLEMLARIIAASAHGQPNETP